MQDLGHWMTAITEIPENFYGFIYRITNLTNDRAYIGKKQARSIRKLKPLKGKKRGRRKEVETDWKTYTGSSPELNSDIERLGKDNFKFEIIRFCDSKWELAYYEAQQQFNENVLLYPNLYYNGIINLRINKAPKETLAKHGILHD